MRCPSSRIPPSIASSRSSRRSCGGFYPSRRSSMQAAAMAAISRASGRSAGLPAGSSVSTSPRASLPRRRLRQTGRDRGRARAREPRTPSVRRLRVRARRLLPGDRASARADLGIRELARVLAPGGRIVLTTDNSRRLVTRILNAPRWTALRVLGKRDFRTQLSFPHRQFSERSSGRFRAVRAGRRARPGPTAFRSWVRVPALSGGVTASTHGSRTSGSAT